MATMFDKERDIVLMLNKNNKDNATNERLKATLIKEREDSWTDMKFAKGCFDAANKYWVPASIKENNVVINPMADEYITLMNQRKTIPVMLPIEFLEKVRKITIPPSCTVCEIEINSLKVNGLVVAIYNEFFVIYLTKDQLKLLKSNPDMTILRRMINGIKGYFTRKFGSQANTRS